MPWLQLKITATSAQAEPIEDALLRVGALAVTFEDNADQPILEPGLGEAPLWDRTLITGLFDANVDTTMVLHTLTSQFTPLNLQPHWEQVEDREWERAWMDNYQPIPCGKRLLICPSWHSPKATAGNHSADTINLLLDPGLAFGTGTHPTTFLCLQWLEQQQLEGLTVVDYGCGSGILAIAALLMGATSVLCVDIDPQALLSTRENATRNHIDLARITTSLPEEAPTVPADIVLANILAGPLIELTDRLTQLSVSGGKLCLSGILAEQAPAVTRHYQSYFEMAPPTLLDGWARLTAVKS